MRSSRSDSRIIAEFSASFENSMVLAKHVEQCGRALADTTAVAIAARSEPAVRRAQHYIDGLAPGLLDGGGKNLPGTAGLWGLRRSSTVEGAALFNGIAAHALDFDDASSLMNGHPSVVLLPALVALAEARDARGMDLVRAYIVGFEICCKLGRALDLTHYSRGWHMTSTVGTIAATAACGNLLDLDAERISNAIGLAVAQTGGTRENFGTDAKSFQAGQVNAAAIRAVSLAEQGFTASPNVLDGKAGYATLYSAGEDLTPVLETLGGPPLEIDGTGIEVKKYPACYGIHRALDGLFDILVEREFGLAEVDRIDIETSYGALAPLVRHPPRNGIEGRFSMEYSIAAAIADRGIGLSTYSDEAVAREEIAPYLNRIVAREASDTMLPRWASISISFKDGAKLGRRVDALRGSPGLPLSAEALFAKVSDCLSWGKSSIRPGDLIRATSRLKSLSVRALMLLIENPFVALKKVQ
jgi:2-methylcitrate dehydratase PrpD